MEMKVKHLEFIQAAISRMAHNSFLLKGWTITLAGGLLALAFTETDRRFFYLALMVLGIFWLLDSYYLSRERNYVALYDHVRKRAEVEVDFSMSANEFGGRWKGIRCAFSKTMLLFYGGFLAVILSINYLF